MIISSVTKLLLLLVALYTVFVLQALGFFSLYGMPVNVVLVLMVLVAFLLRSRAGGVWFFSALCGGFLLFILSLFSFWVIPSAFLAAVCAGVFFMRWLRTGNHVLDLILLLISSHVLLYGLTVFFGPRIFSFSVVGGTLVVQVLLGVLMWYVLDVCDCALPSYL